MSLKYFSQCLKNKFSLWSNAKKLSLSISFAFFITILLVTALPVNAQVNTFYKDTDGDGYGNPDVTIEAEGLPEGYVINSDDCDDSTPTINPDAEEICDGRDNNCDGQIDGPILLNNYEEVINLNAGWNLVSLNLSSLNFQDAQGMARMINELGGNCVEVNRWINGAWEGYVTGLPFNNFSVEGGKAYFIKCTTSSTLTLTGTPIIPSETPSEISPHGIPLAEIPEETTNIAKEMLESLSETEEGAPWKTAQLAPEGYPIYNPAMNENGAAYMEFKVIGKEKKDDRGYIFISLTINDSPLVEYSTQGPTNTEELCKLAKSSEVKIFRYDDSFMAAENNQGEAVAHTGHVMPVKYPDSILNYIDIIYEHTINVTGENEPSNLPDFHAEPYENYHKFKEDYMSSERYKFMRERIRKEAELDWHIYNDEDHETLEVTVGNGEVFFPDKNPMSYALDDPDLADIYIRDIGIYIFGNKVGTTILHVHFAEGDSFYVLNIKENGEPIPRYLGSWTPWTIYYAGSWNDQRQYVQENCCGCVTGCGPVAWAMLYGWWDKKGYSDLIDGTAPFYLNNDVRTCISSVRNHVSSYCVAGQAATNPWNMPKGFKWAHNRGRGYSIDTKYASPGIYINSARNRASSSIKDNNRPAIIGIGFSKAHYCLAYAYANRKKIWHGYTIDTQRSFKVNMGSYSNNPVWKKARVWYGAKALFW